MLEISKTEGKKERLYLEVYGYYRDLILNRKMGAGTKMPSLRKCAQELGLSRTTIESAYLQLAADGYILAKAQSGYYVTDIAAHRHETEAARPKTVKYRYDFASAGADKESFRFDLWSRYIKSALRQDERMLTYGEAQGEPDLREALCEYVRTRRNILCSPEDIVVGASVQSLLQILCPLIKTFYNNPLKTDTPDSAHASGNFNTEKFMDFKKLSESKCANNFDSNHPLTVSFPTPSFVQGATVFSDFGFEVHYRDKDSRVIYVSPAHMTKWGEIMPVKRRLELLKYAAEHGSLVIEDDYENEFVYMQKPTPSLFGLSGGENVVYIGSFSRLLLPSIRVSFLILPSSLLALYREKADFYNQTASKSEQIALCQFIRDGHLSAQIRKLRRLYQGKLAALQKAVKEVFGSRVRIQLGAAGTSLALTLPCAGDSRKLTEKAAAQGLRIHILKETEESKTFLLSCSSMPVEDFVPACKILKNITDET